MVQSNFMFLPNGESIKDGIFDISSLLENNMFFTT